MSKHEYTVEVNTAPQKTFRAADYGGKKNALSAALAMAWKLEGAEIYSRPNPYAEGFRVYP